MPFLRLLARSIHGTCCDCVFFYIPCFFLIFLAQQSIVSDRCEERKAVQKQNSKRIRSLKEKQSASGTYVRINRTQCRLALSNLLQFLFSSSFFFVVLFLCLVCCPIPPTIAQQQDGAALQRQEHPRRGRGTQTRTQKNGTGRADQANSNENYILKISAAEDSACVWADDTTPQRRTRDQQVFNRTARERQMGYLEGPLLETILTDSFLLLAASMHFGICDA